MFTNDISGSTVHAPACQQHRRVLKTLHAAAAHNVHGSPAGDNRGTKLTWLGPACSRGDDAVPAAGQKLASEDV